MDFQTLNKGELRKTLLAKRLSLQSSAWQSKNLQICRYLQQSPHFLKAQTILTYCSLKQEPDLSELMHLYPEKTWGLPRCVGKALQWHRWCWGDRDQIGAYGISEPLPTAPLLSPQEVDLIWVPAVACDHQFYRLGYGGGYFDRLFSQADWSSIFRVGIVFDQAVLSHLPRDPWDQPLDAICTESGYRVAVPPRSPEPHQNPPDQNPPDP